MVEAPQLKTALAAGLLVALLTVGVPSRADFWGYSHSGDYQPASGVCSPKEYEDPYWLTSEYLDDKQLQILSSRTGWLDNGIMNGYMSVLKRGHSDVFAMDLYFYVQLELRLDEMGASIDEIVQDGEMLSKHPSSDRLARYRLILVPALLNSNHWTLVAVEPARRLVTFYDSLGSRSTVAASQVRDYFAALFGESRNQWRIVVATGIARQTNGYDCGVFALKYAENLINGQSLKFSQADVTRERAIIQSRLFSCY